jgi:PAS domain S-box-containing protein
MHNQSKAEDQPEKDPSAVVRTSKQTRSRALPEMSTDVGMILQLADGSIQACNPRAHELLGLTSEQMQGCTSFNCSWQAIHEDGSPFPGETHPPMLALQSGQPCSNVVMGFYQPNGELIWLNLTSQPLFQANLPGQNSLSGNFAANMSAPYAVVTTFTQIDLPQSSCICEEESELSLQQVTLLDTLESISDAFFSVDRDWRFTYLNPQATQLLNRQADDLIGKIIWDEFPEAVGSLFEQQYHCAIREQVTVSFESFYPPLNSWYTVRAYPITSGLAVYFQDVTQQKYAQAAFLQQEQTAQYRLAEIEAIYATAPIGLCFVNTELQFVRINDRLAEINGIPASEHLGKTLRQMLPKMADELEPLYQQVIQTGVAIKQLEVHGTNSAQPGVERDWLLSLYPLKVDDERVLGVNVMVDEITERKQVETALIQVNGILRSVIDGTSDVIFVKDLQGRYVIANSTAADWLGTTIGSMLDRDDTAFFPPEKAQLIQQTDRQVMETGEFISYEEEIPKQGVMRSLLSAKYPWRDLEGNIIGVIGISRDITERKQTEVALQEQTKLLQTIVDSIGDGLILANPQGEFVLFNQAAQRIFGPLSNEKSHCEWSSTYGLFLSDLKTLFPSEELPLSRAIRGEYVNDVEVFVRRNPTLEGRWVSISGYPVINTSNEITGGVILCRDITERKRGEEALQASENRFRQLTNSMPQMIWTTEASGELNYVSDQWLNYTGLTLEQTRDRNAASLFIHPDEVESSYQQWQVALEVGTIYQTEMRLKRANDGSYRWFLVRAVPIRDEQGEVVEWCGTSTDIDDRKRIEEELRQKNAILDVINQFAPTPIFVKDREGRIIYANPATLEVLGKPASEVIGYRDRDDLYPLPQLGVIVSENDRRIMESGETQVVEESPDGIRTYLGTKTPYRNQAGEVIGLIGIANEITDRVLLERDRERILQQEQAAREAAEKANRIKDEFLAVLSHELRSPLNPILGWAKLLQTGKLNATKTTEALATIERNAKLQSQLIEDLLDVSRILQGKLSLNVIPVRLTTIIAAAQETVRLAAEAKNIQIQTFLASNIGQVLGDAGRLQQILWNLLSNAVKFTPTGGRVEVRLTQINHHAQIQVSDTGKGINSDFLPHVFDHFRQEDGATTRKFGGLGLGLAIVRQLVELHGGTVFVNSSGEGQGATFTVRLPLLNEAIESVKDSENSLSLLPIESSSLAGLKIIVVDDEPDSRNFITFVLKQAGAEVIALSSAIDVLESIPKNQPDLLISDIGMPEMDGYMLIEQIRTQLPPQYRQLCAIALTAYAGEVNERQVLAAGFQQHLTKPVEPKELIATVTRLVRDCLS